MPRLAAVSRPFMLVATFVLLTAPAHAQPADSARGMSGAPAKMAAPPAAPAAPATAAPATAATRDPRLPASETQAAEVLETSPRHGEYVDIALPGSPTPLRTWVVYPERRDKAPVVIVIHEIFGLSPWVRALGDQLAHDGFIAVVPDLVSGLGPGGGGTDSTHSRDEVVALVRQLRTDTTNARLDAVFNWAAAQPAALPKIATVGFCWGGGRSFDYAAHQPKLKAAVVYYGVSPDSAALQQINAPVLGLYGGDDARVDATIDAAKQALAARHRSYEPNLFEGAGHGFLRQQNDRDGANLRATQQAWPKTIAFLKKNLGAR